MELEQGSESSYDEEDDEDLTEEEKAIRKEEREKKARGGKRDKGGKGGADIYAEESEVQNLYSEDPSKLLFN